MMSKTFLSRAMPVFVLLIYTGAVTVGSFAGGTWASLGISAALILFAADWRIAGKPAWPQRDLTVFAFIALSLIAILNLNSSHPDLSQSAWVNLVTIFLPLLLLFNGRISGRVYHPQFATAVLIAALVGVAALSIELYLGVPLLRMVKGLYTSPQSYNRGFSYLVVLAFAIMAAARCDFKGCDKKKIALLAGFILILLIAAGLTESRASKLALVLGLVVVACASVAPIVTRYALTGLLILITGWPFAAQWVFAHHYNLVQKLPDSWNTRMEIWDYMSYRIMERPWLGWGLNTSHTLPFQNPDGALYAPDLVQQLPAAHPHNVVIQLWVELGLPGLALGLAFAVLMLEKASGLDRRLAPFAMGAWMAALTLSLIAYSFWTDSMFAVFAMTGFVFRVLQSRLEKTGSVNLSI